MKKFSAIEGLRGWLAWTVVLSHLALSSNIHAKGLGPAVERAGRPAVLIFVIISGFVITHLVIERPEPYGTYLVRRFMRIFPLFAIMCIIGYFTTDIYAINLSRVPWVSDAGFSQVAAFFADIARSDHEFFWAHVFAHLTMLHGVISNTLLPLSAAAFNSPAWSISLEWQFYLIAPFAIMLAHRRYTIVWLALAIAILECAYQLGFLGAFDAPTFLPGAAGYFALGIASRIAYPIFTGASRGPSVIFALVLVLVPLGWEAVPLLVWALVLTGMTLNRMDAATASFARGFHCALEGRVPTYFGSRSYSIYLSHFPIIAVCHSLWLSAFPMALSTPTFFGLSLMTVPSTLIASELLYRGIELPGIALGSWLARRSDVVSFPIEQAPLSEADHGRQPGGAHFSSTSSGLRPE
jgi:peptidoglycan/LPS O-acetylase OafA/YrhL